MQKLNLGCGKDYKEGYINVYLNDVKCDFRWDIRTSLPWKTDSIDEIIINNVLCQIRDSWTFQRIMNDMWSITKPDGSIYIRVPNAKDICAFQDPEDCRYFTDQTFTYMQYDHRRYEQYGKHYGYKPFDVELLEDNGRQMTFKLCPKKD